MRRFFQLVFIFILSSIIVNAKIIGTKGSDITITPVDPICLNNSSFRMQANPVGGIWSGIGITNPETGEFDPSIAGPGNYLITYSIIVDDDTVSENITISVLELPEINIVRTPYTDCAPASIEFTNKTDAEDYLYNWEAEMPGSLPNQYSNLKTTSFEYSLAGIYSVHLNVTTSEGCTDTAKVLVTIQNPPKADFNSFPTKTGLFNPRIEFEDRSTGALVWEWDFGDGNISNKQHPVHMYRVPGEYNVVLRILSEFLCSDSIVKTVTIVEDHKLYFPTAINITSFENNEFYPKGVGIDKDNYELIVYNRFGEEIFKTKDFEKKWAGKYNSNKGEYVPQGLYSYFCRVRDLNGRFHVYSGQVSVFR
jgi:PKD repeat protein